MKNALMTIARDQSAAGNAWAALTAQLAADTLTVAEVLEQHPRASIDVARLKTPADAGTLRTAVRGHRAAVAAALSDPTAGAALGAALDEPDLTDLPLSLDGPASFREAFLKGRNATVALEQLTGSALRYRQFAARLVSMGDHSAAERALSVADRAHFEAHHLETCLAADDSTMSLLHTATLLAEHFTGKPPAGDTATARHRSILAAATLTDDPIEWESVPGLAG